MECKYVLKLISKYETEYVANKKCHIENRVRKEAVEVEH